jgi:hypothetical protein
MKIKGPDKTGKSGKADKSKKAGKTGKSSNAFYKLLNRGVGGVKKTAGAAPTANIGNLLSVQAMGDALTGGGNRAAHDHGGNILHRLEELQFAILDGRLNAHQLQNLVNTVADDRPYTQDDRLNAILDEIELRARVELAKLKRR